MIALVLAMSTAATTCETRILDYATWREAPGEAWTYSGPGRNGSSIALFGAEHLRNPAHPQFARMADSFTRSGATVAFFEGPDRGSASDAEEAIRTQGESGYLRFLANKAGIPARSLEPSPVDMFAGVSGQFEGDRLMPFFVLREAARLRDREGLKGEALDAAVAKLLAKAAPLARQAKVQTGISDLPSLDAAAGREWPARNWRDLPSDWFSPLGGPPEATFLPAINRAVSDYRNRHMYRLIVAEAEQGRKVFVVVGRNHVPMIAPALDCALKR